MLIDSVFSAVGAVGTETAGLLGSGDSCRLYPGQAPAGCALPYVVMTVIGGEENPTHDSGTGPVLSDVQFSIVAETYRGAALLRAALRGLLDNATLGDDEKTAAFDERDGFSEATDQHLLILSASIWHTPPITAN